MDDFGAPARQRRRGRSPRLRRFLAASAAVLAGATGVIVATPQLASAAVSIDWGEINGQHYVQGESTTIDGFCRQNGPNAFVESCSVEIWSGSSLLSSHTIPVGFHQNIVEFGVPAITSSPGGYTAIARVTGTGSGVNSGAISYYVDPAGPPPVAPPSATINSPGPGHRQNPGGSLNLEGFCTPGDLPLANCYGQVWGPDGYHDVPPGGGLPTSPPGDYYVRLTASDGTTEVSTDSYYHVNLPPGAWVQSPSYGQVVNEGSAFGLNAFCWQQDNPITGCVIHANLPDGGFVDMTGGGNIPTSQIGWHNISVDSYDNWGQHTHYESPYRVNALPKVFIDAPLWGERFYTGDDHASDYHCTDVEGIASCVGNVADGANVDTSVAGPKDFVVTATDNDGAVVADHRPYTVYDRPVAHLDGPAVGTVINPGDPAPVFDGYCTGGMPNVTCTMTVARPGGPVVTLNTGDTLPIDTYATYTMRVHIVDDIGTESTVTRTYKVNEPPHIDVDTPVVEHETFVGQDLATAFDCWDNDGTVVTCDGEDSPIAVITDVPGHYFYDVLAVDDDGASTRASVPYEVHPVVGPCRGRGLSLLNQDLGDANPAADPCASTTAITTSLNQIIGPPVQPNPNPLQKLLGQVLAPLTNTVKAGVIEGRTVRTAPATFRATADVASAQINIIAGVNIEVTGVHSEAQSKLTTCTTAQLSGLSRIGTIKLNGVPLVVGEQPLTVPLLGLGTLYLNQRVVTQTGITQRALFLDLAGTALDVIIAEATVNPYCG